VENLREEQQRPRPLVSGRELFECPLEQLPCAVGVARGEAVVCGLDTTSGGFLRLVRGRQPYRRLAELGGSIGCPASVGSPSALIERFRHVGGGPFGGKRQVARSFFRFAHQLGKAAVNRPAIVQLRASVAERR